jgi:hypothetical protein
VGTVSRNVALVAGGRRLALMTTFAPLASSLCARASPMPLYPPVIKMRLS